VKRLPPPRQDLLQGSCRYFFRPSAPLGGVIPSGAVLQAKRGISRVPSLSENKVHIYRSFSKLRISILSVGISLSPLIALPLPQSNQSSPPAPSPAAPLTLDEVLRIIKQSKSDPKAAASVIAERGVAFELEEKIQKKLQKAGASDDLLAEIWKVTPSGKAQMRALLTSPSGVELQASAAEAMALKEIQNENAPAPRLKLVDAFEKKFPSSPLLSYVYTEAARAHQQDGTLDEAVQFARKSLKLDPDNTYSLIILALVLPQPTLLKGNGNEIQAQLTEAAADANRALTLLDKLQKRPDETDEQFQTRKRSLTADCHFALGMGEMQRDQFDKAVTDYQAAISSTSKPTFQYFYRLAEAYASEGHVSEAIQSLQKASELARGTPMQKVADDFMAELQQKSH
jgi:tetratricopeptide (TPR) repeat protein